MDIFERICSTKNEGGQYDDDKMFLEVILTCLIPSSMSATRHPNPEFRIVAVASVRSLMIGCLKSVALLNCGNQWYSAALLAFLNEFPRLLLDCRYVFRTNIISFDVLKFYSPLPLYCSKILQDLLSISKQNGLVLHNIFAVGSKDYRKLTSDMRNILDNRHALQMADQELNFDDIETLLSVIEKK